MRKISLTEEFRDIVKKMVNDEMEAYGKAEEAYGKALEAYVKAREAYCKVSKARRDENKKCKEKKDE